MGESNSINDNVSIYYASKPVVRQPDFVAKFYFCQILLPKLRIFLMLPPATPLLPSNSEKYVNAVNLRWVFELVIYLDRRPAYTRTGDWPNLEVRQGHKLPCSLLRKAWEASSSSITLWKILLVSNIASTGCSRIFSRSSGAEGGLGERGVKIE